MYKNYLKYRILDVADRLPNCSGYGSVCYDPRFVGGDGQMFYFHGAKGEDFALVSDDQFQINVHFIGKRPEGRTRDFTWVQALAVMFGSHTLVIGTLGRKEGDRPHRRRGGVAR